MNKLDHYFHTNKEDWKFIRACLNTMIMNAEHFIFNSRLCEELPEYSLIKLKHYKEAYEWLGEEDPNARYIKDFEERLMKEVENEK